MKTVYYFRVFFISIEFAALVISYSALTFFETELLALFKGMKLNDKIIDWALLAPAAVLLWTLTSAREVLFPSEVKSKTFHEWPDFWKLKIHFNVGVFNSIVFSLAALFIGLFYDLKHFHGLWYFTTCFFIALINAFSFYMAHIAIKIALMPLNDK